MRDLACFLASERGKQAWALTDVHDAEASSEEGLCCKCYAKCKRYGIGANPLCRSCFPEVTAKWGPGVRQKGYNA